MLALLVHQPGRGAVLGRPAVAPLQEAHEDREQIPAFLREEVLRAR